MRSTRRLGVLVFLCVFLGSFFVAVAAAHHGAPGRGGPHPEGATSDPESEEHSQEPKPEPGPSRSPGSKGDSEGNAEGAHEGEGALGSGAPEESAGTGEVQAPEQDREVEAAGTDAVGDVAQEGSLHLEVTGGGTLVQVGGTVTYGIEVTNPGEAPLTDVVVQTLLAPELDPVAVSGAAIAGSSLTWTVPLLAPEATHSIGLDVRVARAGDLHAETDVNASALEVTEPATETLDTYIAATRGSSITNPSPRIIEETIVVRPRQVAVRAEDRVLGRSMLPATGAPVGLIVALGALLIVTGLLALARARELTRAASARTLVICLLVLTACTADTQNGSERAAPETPAPVTSPTEDEEEEDEVLGTVVEPDDVDEDDGVLDPDAPDTSESEPSVGETIPQVALQTVTVQERVVRRRLLDVDEIPLRRLGSTDGANTISLQWTGSDISSATSSIVFDASALAEVTTSLGSSNGALDVGVTLTNLLPDRRLSVSGRLVHEVDGPGGFHAVMSSAPIDVVLNPGGSTTHRFTYALPAGDFTVTSKFAASQ